MQQKVKIFLFHRVSPVRDNMWDPIDPALFRKLIRYIYKNYSVFTVEELFLNYQNINKNIKKPLACITFDDGYKDFIDYALPILDELKLKSSMYIVSQCISSNLPPWTYIVDYLFVNSKKLNLNVLSNFIDFDKEQLVFSNFSERICFGKKLKPLMKKMPDSKRKLIYNQIVALFDDVEIPSNLMMNKDEIIEIFNEGVIIGSHSVSHPLLAQIEDENNIFYELKNSSDYINDITGSFPQTISYPVGSFDERVIEISKKVGYKLGLAVEQKPYIGNIEPNFLIPRIEAYNENYIKSILRLNGYIERIKKFL